MLSMCLLQLFMIISLLLFNSEQSKLKDKFTDFQQALYCKTTH